MKEITPAHIRYIKLGDSGRWAQESISEGSICFGYHSIPHETCQAKTGLACANFYPSGGQREPRPRDNRGQNFL